MFPIDTGGSLGVPLCVLVGWVLAAFPDSVSGHGICPYPRPRAAGVDAIVLCEAVADGPHEFVPSGRRSARAFGAPPASLVAAHASTSGSDNRHLMARMSMVAVLSAFPGADPLVARRATACGGPSSHARSRRSRA